MRELRVFMSVSSSITTVATTTIDHKWSLRTIKSYSHAFDITYIITIQKQKARDFYTFLSEPSKSAWSVAFLSPVHRFPDASKTIIVSVYFLLYFLAVSLYYLQVPRTYDPVLWCMHAFSMVILFIGGVSIRMNTWLQWKV